MTTAPTRLAEELAKAVPLQARTAALFNSLSYYGSLITAALVPLPFGSARPWAWEMLAVVIGALLILRAVGETLAEGKIVSRFGPVTFAGTLFSAALAWAVFQCLPWAPASWTHPLWHAAASLLPGLPVVPRISIDPATSETRILRLISYAALFWLTYRGCRDPTRARLLLKTIVALSAAYGGWGLFIYWSGNRSVLWFEKWTYGADLTSIFVNRNSYAAFCGLACVAALGLLVDALLRSVSPGQSYRALLRTFAELLTGPLVWLLAAVLVITTALLLTHSRGGAMATVSGVTALLAAALIAPSLRDNRRLLSAIAVGIGIAGLLVVFISGAATLSRVAGTSLETEGRPEIYEFTLQALRERPLLGTGLGTFKTVFQAYRTENMKFVTDLAHDDYLENMLELGIPAAFALFASIFVLFLACARGVLRRGRDAIIPCVAIGATVLVAIHSLVDFSLQIPAVATYFVLLLGAGAAQSFSISKRARTGTHSSE